MKVFALLYALLALWLPPLDYDHPPVCDASGRHVKVAYVHDVDRPSHYESNVSAIRRAVHEANQIFHEQGVDIRVECEGRRVKVHELALPVEGSANRFTALAEALAEPGVIWWVAYDGRNGTIGGSASLHWDDRPGPENLNNQGGSLAVVYAADGRGPWAHELLHALGAIQHSAPNSDGTGHCTDGYDLLCQGRQLDRGKDDYFHLDPPPGSYLATHWNVARSDFLARR